METRSPHEVSKEYQEKQRKQRNNRHYTASLLPVFRNEAQEPARQEVLLSLYSEICNSWRALTDVRFKLLGFVPSISGLILINLLTQEEVGKGLTSVPRIAISIFGLLITIALAIYDQRNSQLYDDLISRGRRIEEELGIDTGQFRGRPTPTDFLINHSNAVNLIYGTSIVGWLFSIVAVGLGWIN